MELIYFPIIVIVSLFSIGILNQLILRYQSTTTIIYENNNNKNDYQILMKEKIIIRDNILSSSSSSSSSLRLGNNNNNNNNNNNTIIIDYDNNDYYDNNNNTNTIIQVLKDDKIMQLQYGEGSPIVNEEYKFIFFFTPKVACTIWKQLFRRMEGYTDWNVWELLPHDYTKNGLKYLSNYSLPEVTYMINSNQWTKAIMIRNPKERILSAYLNKAGISTKTKDNNIEYITNICKTLSNRYVKHTYNYEWNTTVYNEHIQRIQNCTMNATKSLYGFFHTIVLKEPNDVHWIPQSHRIDSKYWNLFTTTTSSTAFNTTTTTNNNNNTKNQIIIGHIENKELFAKQLLMKIGAWEKYGKTGWGKYNNESIFMGKPTVGHATNAKLQLKNYYDNDDDSNNDSTTTTTTNLEYEIEQFYHDDYELSIFNFSK